MAHTYTRTVTVVPSSAEYSWTNPANGWITINQVGSSDTWEITVNDNQTNQARSATLTVNHADGTTTNSINVNQAAGGITATVTPTPTPSSTPVPTVTPTLTIAGTITLNNNGTSSTPLVVTSGSSSKNITFTIGPNSGTVVLSNVPSWLNDSQVMTSSTSGIITIEPNTSLINSTSATITVTSSANAIDYIYVYYDAGEIVEDEDDDKAIF